MATKFIPCTYGRYTVSDDGQVFDQLKGREVIPYIVRGYLRVLLMTTTGPRWFYVHRLVAVAFLAGRSFAKNIVNHLNNVPTDNRVENLAWVTPRENVLWHGGNLLSGLKRGRAVIAIDRKTGHGVGIWPSARAAARAMSVSHSNILRCIHGQCKTCCGYYWRAV